MAMVAGMLACIVFPIIVARPEYGAYIILLANPLIVGIARGQLGSVLRPNEFLIAFVLIAICVQAVLLVLGQRRSYVSYDRVDTALLLLVAAGSAVPVLWRYARGLTLSEDDLLYAVVLLKYYALFRVFRYAVTTRRQVEVCLILSIASALIVAVIGVSSGQRPVRYARVSVGLLRSAVRGSRRRHDRTRHVDCGVCVRTCRPDDHEHHHCAGQESG